jgi:hypothetical protein
MPADSVPLQECETARERHKEHVTKAWTVGKWLVRKGETDKEKKREQCGITARMWVMGKPWQKPNERHKGHDHIDTEENGDR